MDELLAHGVHLLWIVPLALLLAYLSSPRFRGDIAESRVRRILAAQLEKNRYTVFNDLLVPSGGGSIAIDHVVVSRFGIFVIESQFHKGWISGAEFQHQWKQESMGRGGQFDNPMHINYQQQQALAKLLKLPDTRFHCLVVMTGHKGFKTQQPEKVVDPARLIPAMRKKGQPFLGEEQVADAFKILADPRFRKKPVPVWTVIRLLLWLVLLTGLFLVFRDDFANWQAQEAKPADPPSQKLKNWENQLICVYSADSGRCACHEPGGGKVEIEAGRCKELAERGSILKQ